jgi:copper chaperone CopZ
MKSIKFIITAILAALISINSFAQTKANSTKTESYKVSGNCDMCKATIEKAAKVDGVSKADWNQKTKIIIISYNPSKVKADDVLKKVAAAGYDNEKFKADDKAYAKLPSCCQYKRNK